MKLSNIAFALVLIAVPSIAFATPGGGGASGVPLDGGLSLLIASGVGYGMKKVAAARKKNAEANK
ncbi:MAG: hypothetical protein EOP51_02430 [Sphingobacteriales bacterium]|nr:MAG: hypothetical protein EOP51_02430 [Sphingobacteriales bacterium]